MLYSAEQDPRTEPARTADEDRRTFTRRIDCADGGRAQQPVNPCPSPRTQREPLQTGTRRLDIDRHSAPDGLRKSDPHTS